MPIEIRELQIKVNVNQPGTTAAPPTASGSAPAGPIANDKQALIAECVEQVLTILRKQKDR